MFGRLAATVKNVPGIEVAEKFAAKEEACLLG